MWKNIHQISKPHAIVYQEKQSNIENQMLSIITTLVYLQIESNNDNNNTKTATVLSTYGNKKQTAFSMLCDMPEENMDFWISLFILFDVTGIGFGFVFDTEKFRTL